MAAGPPSATKPNIVVILADDLGWGDVRAMRPESTLATPRIDSIAAAGMRFTDAHSAAAVCSPSRYALLTGRYGWRSYLSSDVLGDRARPLIDSDLPTLGSMLQQYGYRTAAIGKWHLGLRFPRLPPDEENDINRGLDWNGEIEGAPVGFGFDEFFGVSGNLSFHPRAYIRDDRITAYPDQPYTPTGLLPSHFRYVAPDFDPFDVLDRLTEEAVDFIDRSAGQENPFFLYFALTAPHVPLIPESRFVGTSGLGYYGDFVAQIDWIVGQVLDALARAGIADDTLLVFTSDNGSPMEDRPNWLATHHVTNPSADWYWSTVHKPNGDWRGIKSTIYEGGHRVPYLVRWPGVVPAGAESAFTFAHVDLYATLADILGHRLEDEEAIDSLSILPVLRGEQATPRRSVVNHSAKGMFAVRSGPWKLVLGNGGGGWGGSGFIGTPFARPYKLYDLSSTPWEGKNLIEERRAHADELEERLSTIRSSTKRSQLYSDDASLGALALSGIEIGEFAGEVWGYSAQVANNVTSTTVTATAADEYATVVISDGKNRTVGTEATVELREGGNTIMVTVTAEDMVTTWTYAVVVSRENAATEDPGLPGASPEITSGSSFIVVEGETAVATLTATDTDTQDSDLIWSLSGGADQAKFIITNSGVLALGAAKDFEAPADTNTDGVYQVTVQVSDGGRTDTADLTVTLANLNEAPTANAGEDQTGIGEGATVTLSGSGSDPDANDALTYAWTQTGGPSVPFFDSALAAPTFVAPTDLSSEATLTFTLRVTDEAGLYDEDETTVGVFSSAPLTAVFEGVPAFHDGMRGFDVWLRFNREVKLSSTAFTNGLLTVDGGWVRRADRLISGSNTHWTFTVMPSGDADVVITLPAGRTCGTTGAVCTLDDGPLSAAVSASVAGPAAPLVTGSTTLSVLEGETAVATLTASDADTTAMDLQWSIPSGAGGGADGGKFTITAGGALTFVTAKDFEDPDDADADGSYQVTVQVSDSRRSNTEDLTVTLSNRNEAPTADAGADQPDIADGATVTLAGSGSDPDADDTLTYAWTQIGGTDVTLSDATTPAPSFTAPAGLTEDATLTFSLKVTDKAGLYHEDAVSVRVKARPPPAATFTVSAAPEAIAEGESATLTVAISNGSTFTEAQTISLAASGTASASDYTGVPATLTLAAGESSAKATLTASVDQEEEEAETVTITASHRGASIGSATVTVTRAEAPALPVVSVAAVEERVVGPIGEFRVSRTGPTAEALEVQVLFENSRSSRTQTLTIRLLPGRSSVTARVQAGDNNLVEDDITVTYTLREGEGYTVSAARGSASVVLEESDIPEFSVSVRPAGIAEGESATVTVAITNGVRFREAQTIDLSVSGTASGSDYTGVPEMLTLRAYKTETTTATLTAAEDEEDEAEETVTITASHGGSEIGSATVTIGGVKPLTAKFAKMPATHDGETRFSFELRFSEQIRISYKTLRDKAFTVTGGAVRKARRLAPPSNLRWEITVAPTSDADVVLELPVTTDCAAARAVCTAAGKRLSERLTATVRGPGTQALALGFSLDPENGRPSGLWSDGATAWVADLDDGKLFAYRLSDGSRSPERDVAVGGAPMGLWSDGETLWVAELTGGLAAYRLSDGSRLPGRDLALPVSTSPVGVWSDGETVWIAEWLGDTVHGYRWADGQRAPARDIRLAPGNLLPVGLWSDGETLWVADWDERMVAYRLSSGERTPDRDVAAKAPDADPSGLWSDGKTLLATGWEGGEVRAHALPAATERAPAAGRAGEPGVVPPIGDPALRTAVVAALGAEAGAEGLGDLKVLDARHGGIRSLAGLEGAVNLKQLDLGFNPLDDTEALAKLPSLRSLNLDGAAPDLTALGSLSGLQRLSLRHNGVSDLSPLAALAQLRELDVGDNRIEDLRPLIALQALAILRADRNRIVDLWPLASLPRLTVVDLGRNRIRDLQALAVLGRLKTLRLDGNGLSAPAPLAGLAGLRELGLAGNAVEDLGALSGLAGLRRLDLRGNPVRDISPLRELPSLGWVHVGASGIDNLSPLDGAPEPTLAGVDDRDTPHQGGHGTRRTPEN